MTQRICTLAPQCASWCCLLHLMQRVFTLAPQSVSWCCLLDLGVVTEHGTGSNELHLRSGSGAAGPMRLMPMASERWSAVACSDDEGVGRERRMSRQR